jgi:hypothetical protein
MPALEPVLVQALEPARMAELASSLGGDQERYMEVAGWLEQQALPAVRPRENLYLQQPANRQLANWCSIARH